MIFVEQCLSLLLPLEPKCFSLFYFFFDLSIVVFELQKFGVLKSVLNVECYRQRQERVLA